MYEPVKPRQRRKRDSVASPSLDARSSSSGSEQNNAAIDRNESVDSSRLLEAYRKPNIDEQFGSAPEGIGRGQMPPSLDVKSLDDSLASLDMFAWTSNDLPLVSPISPLDSSFPYPSLDEPLAPDDVDEVIQRDTSAVTLRSRHSSHSSYNPTLALIAPIPTLSPRLEFCSPVFSEFSDRTNRRGLVDHFCNVLSHLIVFREEGGNPFQQLVLPLSHNSKSVTNAIYALASAHLEYRGIESGEKSVYFHNQAIQGLARLIEQGSSVNRNELLASIMLLVYYEVVR